MVDREQIQRAAAKTLPRLDHQRVDRAVEQPRKADREARRSDPAPDLIVGRRHPRQIEIRARQRAVERDPRPFKRVSERFAGYVERTDEGVGARDAPRDAGERRGRAQQINRKN